MHRLSIPQRTHYTDLYFKGLRIYLSIYWFTPYQRTTHTHTKPGPELHMRLNFTNDYILPQQDIAVLYFINSITHNLADTTVSSLRWLGEHRNTSLYTLTF